MYDFTDEEMTPVSFSDCRAIAETKDALLVAIPIDSTFYKNIWVPQSQIDEDSEVWKKDDEGTLVITRWIAEKKGLV